MDLHSAYISASHNSILHQTFVVLDILLYLQQIHLNTAYEGHVPDQANTPKSAAPWIYVKQHYYTVPLYLHRSFFPHNLAVPTPLLPFLWLSYLPRARPSIRVQKEFMYELGTPH